MKILRISDMLELLNVSRATLFRMSKEGKLPPKVKISHRIHGWLQSDIESWLEENKATTTDS